MIFNETPIGGAFLIELERHEDERGFFARSFCRREFEAHGLDPTVAQCNVSLSREAGTMRGLHSQAPPHEEAKLVRCTHGSIHDVILDLRWGSATFLRHFGVALTADERNMLYVPKGVYHGFLTLEPNCEVFYQMSEFYVPGKSLGVRWDDPAFGIEWPREVRVMSDRDRSYPDFADSPPPGTHA